MDLEMQMGSFGIMSGLDEGEGEAVQAKDFEFIDLSVTSTEAKRRNRTLARSHAMKVVRGGQRRRRQPTRLSSTTPVANPTAPPEEEDIETIWTESAAARREGKKPAKTVPITQMGLFDQITSFQPTFESAFGYDHVPALRSYSKAPAPRLHPLFDMCMKSVWPQLPLTTPATGLCPLATEWSTMIRTSPALFHSSMWMAGVFIDSQNSTPMYSQTAELIDHKVEAIRQINTELNGDVPEALILAVLALTKDPRETDEEKAERVRVDSSSRFKRPPMPPYWSEMFTGVVQDEIHFNGAQTIVSLKGGLGAIKSLCVAKAFSHFDFREAALNVRKPKYPHYKLPIEIDETSTNILTTEETNRGVGFQALLDLGRITADIHKIMLAILNLTMKLEAFSQFTLTNPNLLFLMNTRAELYHNLLLQPTGAELEMVSGTPEKTYECVRLASMVFASSTIFPILPSTGCHRRIVSLLRATMNDLSFEGLGGSEARAYIWILFLVGIAAQETEPRKWFIDRLRYLTEVERIERWSDVKNLVGEYLWMSSVCDEGGMEIWDEVRSQTIPPHGD